MTQPENRPPLDRTFFLPLGIGVLSLFGICLLLFINQVVSSRSTVPPPETATPFKFLLLGTEPGISTLGPEEESEFTEDEPEFSEEFPEGETSPTVTRRAGLNVTAVSGISSSGGTPRPTLTFPPNDTPTLRRAPTNTHTPRPASTPLTLTVTPVNLLTLIPQATSTHTATSVVANTPTRTPTSASAPPLNAGTYDNTDHRLVYSGNWIPQTNVSGAYQGTLHVSSTLGSSVTFRFIGQEVRLFYQSGPSLGTLRININGAQVDDLSQADSSSGNSEWVSAPLVNGTHVVTISHLSGGSVNLDYVIVPEVPGTATPTATSNQ
jgi:hypothetical protein